MILVTGANGLVGKYVIEQLRHLYENVRIRALVRHKEKGESLYPYVNDFVVGDLSDKNTIKKALSEEVKVIIHIAGIRYSLNILEEAMRYLDSLQQIIFIHTTGMYSKYREYAKLYIDIESKLIPKLNELKMAYTILRPTMIYGSMKDKNMHKLIRFLDTKPFFPLFGGQGKMQPIYYKDLGDAILGALHNEQAYFKEFNVSGGSILSYSEIVHTIKKLLNSKTIIIPIPYNLALLMGWLYEKLFSSPIISFEQIRRLSEDKVFDHEEAKKVLGFHPISFLEGIQYEIEEYKRVMKK